LAFNFVTQLATAFNTRRLFYKRKRKKKKNEKGTNSIVNNSKFDLFFFFASINPVSRLVGQVRAAVANGFTQPN